MKTITLDILDNKAINLLKDLESLNIIRLHNAEEAYTDHPKSVKDLKGMMTKQSPEEIDRQLNDLRTNGTEIPLGY